MRPQPAKRVAGWLGWAAVVPPAALAAARLTQHEGRSLVLAAEALTPVAYLPAYAALGLGLFSRQRVLAVLAGALVALHLSWTLPELRPARPLPAEAAGAPHVRLFSANLLYTNTRMEGIAAEIRRARPDVVVFQELSPANLAALEKTGVLDGFPFSLTAPAPDPTGSGVFSKLVFAEADSWKLGDMDNARVTLDVGGRRLRLYDVHTNAPFGTPGAPRWASQLASIRDAVLRESDPLVVAGDFNATYVHRRFRDVLATGLRDAHVDRGRGWAATWPRDLAFVPPLVRIDHILVSKQVAVLHVSEGEGRGSDHRPLIADLAVLA